MSKPLVSIMIAAYNVQDYIKQCIDSVINQTYDNLEIIIVDDGSTDKTGNICDSYLMDKRVKVVHQKNVGLAEVRNVAISLAQGDYLAFIDGDDFVSPYYVQNLYDALVQTNATMSVCNFTKYFDRDKLKDFAKNTDVYVLDKKEYLNQILYQKFECNAWGKLYSKQIAQKLVYPKGALYEDLAAFPSLIDQITDVAVVSSQDYVYRQNSSSILHKPYSHRDRDCLVFMDNLSQYVLSCYPEMKEACNCRKFSIACNLFFRVDKKTHKQEYLEFWCLIKQFRSQVVKQKLARKKNRYAAILSYFGKAIFKFVYKLV